MTDIADQPAAAGAVPPLRLLHLDEHLVAVSKPAGLAVHRGPRSDDDESFLLQRLGAQLGRYLYPVHRLDRATSGILTFALEKRAATALQQSLAAPTAVKEYLALARGDTPDAFSCRRPLTNEAGEWKDARTDFATLARFYRVSLLRARLYTGRTHQIRRHLDHTAHQVIGDTTHGKGRINQMFRRRHGLPRMFLHAFRLAFDHPVSGERLDLWDPLPDDLAEFLAALPEVPPDLVARLRARPLDGRWLALSDGPRFVRHSYVTHLESTADGSRLPAGELHQTHQGKPLLVRYDLDALRAEVPRTAVLARPADLWRFSELLPLRDPRNRVSLGETETPLLDCPRLATALGVARLRIKDESRLPGGSFKARGMALAVSMANELGVTRVAVPTAGNAGGALAAYAARAGMRCVVVMPTDTPIVNRLEVELHGAEVVLHDGLIHECGRIVRERYLADGWFDVSTLREPYRIEGKKTMGLELAVQTGFRLPDAIFYPTGGGTGLIGMWKAFAELGALGWLDAERRPRMFACQSTGCDPLVRAFDQGLDAAPDLPGAHTAASGIRVPKALGDFLVLRAVRESGGAALATAESELPRWLALAMAREGIALCPESAACLGAIERCRAQGTLRADADVVVFNTGAAQKYVEFLELAARRASRPQP
ncbi:MAG: threonine synthase [Planctomycetes bacterium]|nr:threonine synthase [Planctomycetota bacterium]